MKKTYISPELVSTVLTHSLPVAASPQVTLNQEKSVDAEELDVKEDRLRYNVWDEDWNEEEKQ
ncbi:MAG: hypothetical protein IKR98_02085 [Bacteroidaceae bacterium]|nr:hypothetical protein [Bacteroidaceae bacterium]